MVNGFVVVVLVAVLVVLVVLVVVMEVVIDGGGRTRPGTFYNTPSHKACKEASTRESCNKSAARNDRTLPWQAAQAAALDPGAAQDPRHWVTRQRCVRNLRSAV